MKKLLFSGPIQTASGYGEHARQILKALVDSKKFDVSVESLRWGQTSFLSPDDPEVREIMPLIAKYANEIGSGVSYDVSVQVTIPNEFRRRAAFNIGITAGIEVDRVSPAWISKTNENVDLVVVPSHHSAKTFADIAYEAPDKSQLRLNKPVLVAPEGFDREAFRKRDAASSFRSSVLPDDLPEFNFISVGLGLDRPIGEDRKNIGQLIKWFCETFKDDHRVGLVLKTSIVNGSQMDRETCISRIKQIKNAVGCGNFPKITLVHGRLSKEELGSLYRDERVKAYVSITHGEGFGLPLIEAAATGLPVLATNWSGHLDFLHNREGKKRFIPVDFELKEVPKSAVWKDVIEEGTRWAYPLEEDFKSKLKKVFLSVDKPREWAAEQSDLLHAEFYQEKIAGSLVNEIVKILGESSQSSTGAAPLSEPPRKKIRASMGFMEEDKLLLYTMPMSAGDVFLSTSIVKSLNRRYPDHKIVFATDQRYGDILKKNPSIAAVVRYENWMMDVPFCESVFDLVFTPNLAVQLKTSNWVRGGKGRQLAHEFAAQCDIPLFHAPTIAEEPCSAPELQAEGAKYIVLHPGSGKGQWESRNFRRWNDVVTNLKRAAPEYTLVQVGSEGDIELRGCLDLRGRTNYNQLADVIRRASCVVCIDSLPMHMASAYDRPTVALFGGSYAHSTGPTRNAWTDDAPKYLLEAANRCNGGKACYKNSCSVDRDNPCINEIKAYDVVQHALMCLGVDLTKLKESFVEFKPKIAGYTHVLDARTHGYPYVESIKSMLGFCDEVIVVDGGSSDDTVSYLKSQVTDERLKIFERKWDSTEPGMDGMQKAYARAMTSLGPDDFLWQQDADEVVHEKDFDKIKRLVANFPAGTNLVHLPVVELWGKEGKVRTDRHSWKWRLSRNDFRITHGINKNARVFDSNTGRTYAKKGMSDGCEYVDIVTGEFVEHKGFYNQNLEALRRSDPAAYGREMNKIFSELPSVYHYSWTKLDRKIKSFKSFWNKTWSNLYNEEKPEDRFPDVDVNDPSSIEKKASELLKRGGEHGSAPLFDLEGSQPSGMKEWLQS